MGAIITEMEHPPLFIGAHTNKLASDAIKHVSLEEMVVFKVFPALGC